MISENGPCESIPENWCDGATDYWRTQDADVNGMLGGFGRLANLDAKGSLQFLNSLKSQLPGTGLVLDVGAGIGRVSKNVLLHVFQKVSLLECTAAFVEKARALLPAERLETVFPVTMQDFHASEEDLGRYDLVWIQWVIIYASDEGLVSFLRECMRLLKPGGKICIKDNVILPGSSKDDGDVEDVLLDKEDCSITRSERYLVSLAQSAGLQLIAREPQPKFPKELFPVIMYAFTPMQ